MSSAVHCSFYSLTTLSIATGASYPLPKPILYRTMVLPRTPLQYMCSRSETSSPPPPLKRTRVETSRESVKETLVRVTNIPASLFLPNDLDFFPTPDSLQDGVPHICLKPRTSLSTPDVLPMLKKRKSSSALFQPAAQEATPLGFDSEAPLRRMKRRRSSLSSCGADTFIRLEAAPMAALI